MSEKRWDDIGERIRALLALDDGWDSYGSPPPDPVCVGHLALHLLRRRQARWPPPVFVVPTAGDSGVWASWHIDTLYDEIDVTPGDGCMLFRLDYDEPTRFRPCDEGWPEYE